MLLIWNSRLEHGNAFREEYDLLLRTFGSDYEKVTHKNISQETLTSFFKNDSMQLERFAITQVFDFEGLKGRLMSSSYIPVPEHPNYEPMMTELQHIFERHEQDGHVFFDYETEVYWGEV